MKRGALIIALTAFFLAQLILSLSLTTAANTCSDPNQIILRISSDSNAHGEVWNGAGNYQTEICYDQIFGIPYTVANPHDCTGSNVVLRLSSSTNAHAEGPTLSTPGYSNVCYGDLSCSLETSSCSAGKTAVVRLANNINAHLEIRTLTNYNYIICCNIGGAPPPPPECDDNIDNDGDTLTDFPADPGCTDANDNDETDIVSTMAYWADPVSGSELPINYLLYLNEFTESAQVKLIAKTAPAGTEVTFKIFDDDPLDDDDIKSIKANANAAGTAEATTTFSFLDFSKGSEKGENPLQLYFTAEATGYSETSKRILLTKTTSPSPDEIGCEKYVDPTTCRDDLESRWKIDAELNKEGVIRSHKAYCGQKNTDNEYIKCSCEWADVCKFRAVAVPNGIDPDDDSKVSCLYGCNIQSTSEDCINNEMTINYLADYKPGSMCSGAPQPPDSKERTSCEALNTNPDKVSCGLSPSLILPFFGFTQFILALVTVALIYSFLLWKKRV